MVRHTISNICRFIGDRPGLRLSLRRCCLLTKQTASVLNSTAAARKQIVATTPATTGRASPSSGNSAGGKGSDGADEDNKIEMLQTKTSQILRFLTRTINFCSLLQFSVKKNWPVLDTPTTLLLSLIRSSMTAITRNSYQDSFQRETHKTPSYDHLTHRFSVKR